MLWAHGAKGAEKEHIAIYRSGFTFVEEEEREKDANIERSMLRGAIGDARGAELELPSKGRRGAVDGVGWEDEAGLSTAGSSAFQGER